MKSHSLKFCLIASLLLQVGCDITLKRKSPDPESAQQATQQSETQPREDETTASEEAAPDKPVRAFGEKDTRLIKLYYANEGNAQVLDDMIKQTWVNKKTENKLKVNETIPADMQIMPLPLELEKILSPLSKYALRIQVGSRVMIMDIKSRRILDVIILK